MKIENLILAGSIILSIPLFYLGGNTQDPIKLNLAGNGMTLGNRPEPFYKFQLNYNNSPIILEVLNSTMKKAIPTFDPNQLTTVKCQVKYNKYMNLISPKINGLICNHKEIQLNGISTL